MSFTIIYFSHGCIFAELFLSGIFIMTGDDPLADVTSELETTEISKNSDHLVHRKRRIVRETPLTIEIKDVAAFTIMCTPCDTVALAVGFVFSEGLIERREDINVLARCPDNPHVIRMQLAQKKDRPPGRHLLIVSSCGICGSEDMEKIIASLPRVPDTLRVTAEQLTAMTELLRQRQEIFPLTGGTHAAGIISRDKLVAVGEDIGRHNAFDKAVGKCLLEGIETAGTAAVLSSRVSFEMAAKAARAGIELVAAVSAPSSLAVETAQRCHITLCGFVRGSEANIYCHPHRISLLDSATPIP